MKALTTLLAVTLAVSAFAAPALALEPISHVGDHYPPRGGPSYSTDDCAGDLGHLRRVYEEQIDGVEDASITPICENDDYGLMRSDGNAGALRQHIAVNETIMSALQAANFRVEDVVGVRMTGDESAIIYVHTFLYR